MNSYTLAIAYFLIALTISISSLVIGFIRKDLAFKLFASAFLCQGLGIFALMILKDTTPWVNIVLGNTLVVAGYLLMMIGFKKTLSEEKIWSGYLWIYLLAALFESVFFTFVNYSFIYRASLINVIIILISVHTLVYLYTKFWFISRSAILALFPIIFVQIIYYIARTYILFAWGSVTDTLIVNHRVANFTFIYFIVYSVIMFIGIILVDSNNRLAEKNLIDPQTGLKNRMALRSLVEKANFNRQQLKLTVIYIDIDNFSMYNDSMGFTDGDQVIIETAENIKECVNGKGTIYRYGGDEFLILTDFFERSDVEEIVKNIQKFVMRPIKIKDRMIVFTVSIGVCIGSDGDTVADTIMKSEKAMYHAKKIKNTAIFYENYMDKASSWDYMLAEDMSHAIHNNEFELYYQPIIDVRTGCVKNAEALIRWNHPKFGLLSPCEFIPLAEKNRLILPITDWVISTVCKKIAEWNSNGIIEMSVSINLSMVSFDNKGSDFSDFIKHSILEAGINSSSLKLEITENSLIFDLDKVLKVFNDLKQHGLKLALDDFGTGYSTFSYLMDLPLDYIKIDRSLISGITHSERDQMIVKSLITIIHGLGLQVIVEGVETREQFDLLKNMDCDLIQGYFISRPIPAGEFEKYILSANTVF